MNNESCIQTIELLRQLALNIHGVIDVIDNRNCNDIINLLKEQGSEKKRIMKVIWETLHEGLSIDTEVDQDWVYEQIRHRIEDI